MISCHFPCETNYYFSLICDSFFFFNIFLIIIKRFVKIESNKYNNITERKTKYIDIHQKSIGLTVMSLYKNRKLSFNIALFLLNTTYELDG